MRNAALNRATRETDISVDLNLDGIGTAVIDTGIGFFDHMLTALAVHSGIDLSVTVDGDLEVDCHHTIEDTGIVIGMALGKALGDKSGICRYGTAFIPMDEALGFACLDISGRPFLVFDCDFSSPAIGEMDTQMVEEFFRALAFQAGVTLHLRCEYGKNDHHKAEALFKAFAHALKQAVADNGGGVLSTKGVL
ncbi:imidazoleglycerol-phosphate dehydratase HisB [Massiliimalia timonensis]|uniref:imidazoleglycerol-phosphate dehydratase HisB n=1 Tax=Massiliimalia timonensis TaxID=1987501 RepID=UPI000B8B7181|nr:imidazoleglycerol-phosphate dehydratase HisB [Massiliimalia timonensis]MBS7175810.1 imidazoleglycerol-phosphate dehydratase HisB [Clostridiales bacterium]